MYKRQAVYREYGTQPGTSVSWEADGKLRTASCLFVEQIDPSIDGGNTALYPTTAAMTWRTDGGQDIRICIYGENANAGGRDFTFEYQFDYRKLPHINAYANSYQTLEGRRRMRCV